MKFGDIAAAAYTYLSSTRAVTGFTIAEQTSGAATDFTNPLTYTVTAADAPIQNYTVTVAPTAIGLTYQGAQDPTFCRPEIPAS